MATRTRTALADPGDDWTRNLSDFESEADYVAALEDWHRTTGRVTADHAPAENGDD